MEESINDGSNINAAKGSIDLVFIKSIKTEEDKETDDDKITY